MHPAIVHVLSFFAFEHLPQGLQEVSKPFHKLANEVAERAPENQETTVALRKSLGEGRGGARRLAQVTL